jgi:cell wall-associated NlpC family hydrolase
MPPTNAQLVLSRIATWNASHPRQQIDPQAALAVSTHEGLSGGIGDGGHAFGPFQLNDAGGVVTGKLHGSPGQRNAWAWTPAGIDYALSGIAHAASNLHGAQAVNAIVTRFERPADPSTEVNRSLATLGLPAASSTGYQGATGSAPAAARPGKAASPTPDGVDALAALLLSRQFEPPQVDQVGTPTNPAVHVEAAQPPDHIDALALAKQFIDASQGAFSNPGFAQYLHGLNGTAIPGSTIAQSAAGAHTATPAAGDLAFFGSPPSHQAVMLDGSHFLHGTNGGAVLRVSSLAHPAYAGGLSAIRSYA